MLTTVRTADQPTFLTGGGELGRLIRVHDWSRTPLGAYDQWPQSLKSALSICLHSSFPTAIYWGPELRLLYNDAWAPIPAERHPWALGRPAAEVWSDIWDVVSPQFASVIETGEGFSTFDQMLPMIRDGVRRETYWNYSFTPIRGEDGSVVGIFNQGHETTERVIVERRGRFLLGLSDRLRALSDPRMIIETAQESLGTYLNANRVGYGEVENTARYFTTDRNWTDGSVPSREGTHDLAGFGPEVLSALRAGIPLLIQDAATDPRTKAPESLAAFDAIDTRAAITASLVKEGRMRAALYVHARTPRAWSEHDARLVTEVAERTWAAIERARAEETRQLLLRELNHRVKNLFAIVSGMVTMTARTAPSVRAMEEALKGRLNALAKAHELIRSAITSDAETYQHTSLRPLIEEVLQPHLDAEHDRQISLVGPEIALGVSAATSLALILHELATNAAKYGALASPEGQLSVVWTVKDEHWELYWKERVPRRIEPPTSHGFGSKLARLSATGQLGGAISFDWQASGVHINLRAPVEQLRRTSAEHT